MLFIIIHSPNALLQSQQRLVNLCSVDLSLLILVDGVGPSLAASKIDKGYLPE